MFSEGRQSRLLSLWQHWMAPPGPTDSVAKVPEKRRVSNLGLLTGRAGASVLWLPSPFEVSSGGSQGLFLTSSTQEGGPSLAFPLTLPHSQSLQGVLFLSHPASPTVLLRPFLLCGKQRAHSLGLTAVLLQDPTDTRTKSTLPLTDHQGLSGHTLAASASCFILTSPTPTPNCGNISSTRPLEHTTKSSASTRWPIRFLCCNFLPTQIKLKSEPHLNLFQEGFPSPLCSGLGVPALCTYSTLGSSQVSFAFVTTDVPSHQARYNFFRGDTANSLFYSPSSDPRTWHEIAT